MNVQPHRLQWEIAIVGIARKRQAPLSLLQSSYHATQLLSQGMSNTTMLQVIADKSSVVDFVQTVVPDYLVSEQ
jgi:hypothetical protein